MDVISPSDLYVRNGKAKNKQRRASSGAELIIQGLRVTILFYIHSLK